MCLSQPAFSADRVAGNMMLINDNGGWCWYQDDKIIYDPTAGNIITSTSAHGNGFGGVGGARSGDVDATTFHIDTGKRTRALMAERGNDDHNMGGLWIRPDGRYLHLYCPHYSPSTTYYRLATNPNNGSAWDPEQSYNWTTIGGPSGGGNLTYTNLHYLSAEGTGQGRLYNIVRWNSSRPNISYSDNNGVDWHYAGKLSEAVGPSGYSYYYHKFRSNGVDRIDFICTEQHPRDYNNSVYHGYIKNGKSYNSFGVEMDNSIFDQTAPGTNLFTPVWLTTTPAADVCHTGWTNELELDKNGYPVCLYQTRYGTTPWGQSSGNWGNTGCADHRFFYGRFDGTKWTSTELCKIGVGLHWAEQDYTGMGCIHPDDANLIYVSTNYDPVTDVNIGKHEIFKGVTYDNGATWNWTQITFDSTVDNIRPAIPQWNANNTAVFWERGDFPVQGQFDMVLVGLVEEQEATLGLVSYTDASTSNTTNSDGSAFSPTGPSGSAGAADGLWHQYTGYGNGGSCFTAGDGGTENVPTIKTTVTGLSAGTYDVFAYFWCDPNADWGIRGGFETSDLLCFNKQSSQFADATQFSGSVTVTGTGVQLYRVYIGRKVVSEGGSIVVYLDNYDSTFSGNVPTRTTYDGVGVASISYVEDLLPPEPNIMTWAAVPTATGPTTITMTATTATDDSPPVQYYFECTTDGDANSDWQTSPTYVATGLTPSTLYSFRVMARDSSPAQNETDWSSTESATTYPPDTTPPTPDPMEWASVPTATGPTSITMTATTATDANTPPVQYYFECTTDGNKSSGWQANTTYVATGLNAGTLYSFMVEARDSAPALNETGWSSTESATTDPPDTVPPTPDPMTWLTVPTATGPYSITMTANTATDACSPPVQYYFECTTDGSKTSGWQASATYSPSGLNPSTSYSFRAKARDSAPALNETGWSSTESATTQPPPTDIEIIGSWATEADLSRTKVDGTNRALIFIAHAEEEGVISLNSVTYGGQPMTKINDIIVGTGWRAYVVAYILDEAGIAAATNDTFVPSWSTTPDFVAYSSVFLQNVNQTALIGASASNSTASSTPNPITTSALATNNGDMVILGATCGNSGSYTLQNGFTEGTDQSFGSTATGVTGYKSATGANEIPSAQHNNQNRQVIIGFVVQSGGAADLPPAAPTGLAATAGNETVSLNWNDNAEADLDGYNVYRSTTQGSGYGKLNVAIVSTSDYIDNTVTNGIPYYYVVKAVDVNGHESGYSNEATATPGYQTCEDVQAGEDGLESDLDGDCYVNYWDLEIVASHWLSPDCEPDNCGGADFEPMDGTVDFYDFSDFAVQWMWCNNPEDPHCVPNW